MKLESQQVLITGAAGWLGTGLLKSLVSGIPQCEGLSEPPQNVRIRALTLPGESIDSAAIDGQQIEVVVGDLRREADCIRFCQEAEGAILFHLAGLIHPRRTRELFEINTDASRNILSAAVGAGLQRVVVMSSNSPIGCNPRPDHLFDEASPYQPYMQYGRSKMLMEQHARQMHESGKIQTVIVRGTWFYGPFQPPRQTVFFKMIRDGMAPIVGSGENRRSMAYIDNVCQGLILAATTPRAAGETYWIADQQPYSMNEIVDTVERLLESEFDIPCRHRRLRLPGFASQAAQGVDWMIQSAGWYHQKIHVLSEMNKTIACSVNKATEQLGFKPTVALEEGMRRSIKWCIEQGLLQND